MINEHIHLIATFGFIFGVFQAGFQGEMSHHKISLCALLQLVLIWLSLWRSQGSNAPWRQTVFFCSLQVRGSCPVSGCVIPALRMGRISVCKAASPAPSINVKFIKKNREMFNCSWHIGTLCYELYTQSQITTSKLMPASHLSCYKQ